LLKRGSRNLPAYFPDVSNERQAGQEWQIVCTDRSIERQKGFDKLAIKSTFGRWNQMAKDTFDQITSQGCKNGERY